MIGRNRFSWAYYEYGLNLVAIAGLYTDRDNFLRKIDEYENNNIEVDVKTKDVYASLVQNIEILIIYLRSDVDTKIVANSIYELIQKIKKEIEILDDAFFCSIV